MVPMTPGVRTAGFRSWLLLSLALAVLALTRPAFANSGPPRILPDGSRVMFTENPGVTLVHETLRAEWDPERLSAVFTVTYTFENAGDAPAALVMWFMSGDYEDQSFRITRMGLPVPTKDVDPSVYHLENWKFTLDPPFVTPLNPSAGSRLDYYGEIGTPARITEWTLELEARAQAEVLVTYEAKSGYLSDSDYFSSYRTLYFALSPARFFNGEALLDFELIVPEHWIAAANLPLSEVSAGHYTLRDYKIGTEDLYITLLDRHDLMFGLNSRRVLFNRTWPIAAAFAIAAVYVVRRRKAQGLVLAAIGVAGLFFFFPVFFFRRTVRS